MLVEVERVTPDEFGTLDELRDFLVLASLTAESMFTRSSENKIQARSMSEEPDLFSAYIQRLQGDELQ